VIDMVIQLLGGISLDPASCEEANKIVRAAYYFDAESDGLKQKWFGNVFLNPPYGKNEYGESNQGIWSQAMINKFELGEFEKGVLLVNASPGSTWFHRLWSYPILFAYRRIKFIRSGSQQTHSNAFVFFGCDGRGIRRAFKDFGRMVYP
jgi:hypothetical protein